MFPYILLSDNIEHCWYPEGHGVLQGFKIPSRILIPFVRIHEPTSGEIKKDLVFDIVLAAGCIESGALL